MYLQSRQCIHNHMQLQTLDLHLGLKTAETDVSSPLLYLTAVWTKPATFVALTRGFTERTDFEISLVYRAAIVPLCSPAFTIQCITMQQYLMQFIKCLMLVSAQIKSEIVNRQFNICQ